MCLAICGWVMFYLVLPPLALPMSLVLIYEQYHPERTWYIDGQQTTFFFFSFPQGKFWAESCWVKGREYFVGVFAP